MSTKIKKNSEGKKVYELAFLLKDLSSEKVVLDFLAQHNAVVLNQSPINSMKLAYPIKKHLTGFFGVINFETETENTKSLSNVLNLSSEVLRFLVIAVPNVKKSSEKAEPKKLNKVEAATSNPVLSNKDLEDKLEEILK
ncbi:MAG: 30S ribosomal protein S6 [Minisyncoccota bacterium]